MKAGMNSDYLVGRILKSLDMARDATTSASRLIHLDLARRYTLAMGRRGSDHLLPFGRSLRPGDTSL